MCQRYKFFIASGSITLVEKAPKSDINKGNSDSEVLDNLMRHANSLELNEDLFFECDFPAEVGKSFLLKNVVIKAGGGFVLNKKNQLLMIYRRGFWDLPKGKLDRGESIEQCAIREVSEECGVSELTINSKPYLTWHLYKEKNQVLVKESSWFKMVCNDYQQIKAQQEEGITEVCWMDIPVSSEILEEAYPSIVNVVRFFS